MTRKFCNMCGREMDWADDSAEFNIHTYLGYGTRYDGGYLRLDLCCNCMERLIEECELNPVEENEYE